MSDIDARFEDLTTEEVEMAVATLAAQVQVAPTAGRTAQEIDQLFELMHGYNAMNRHVEASKVFVGLQDIIADYRTRYADDAAGLDYFFDWSMMALKMTPESRGTFVCMPLYYELLETFDEGPEVLRHRGLQARTQLLRHVEYWLGKGGDLEVLAAEDQEFIRAARDQYAELHDVVIEAAEARADFLTVVNLYRDAAQFYLLLKKPNDAIASLKEAVEYLPDTPNFQEVEKADLFLQIGRIFVGYGKHEIAIRYFNQALDLYKAGGDEYEMHAYQVEGWIEEAQKRQGK
jgi:tetratricopeptide (TPR) repeat protein